MADAYSTFGSFLLLKRRSQDSLGTLWRAGEMERTGFKRIVWLRRFDSPGLDRSALISDAATANQLTSGLRATNVVRNASYGSEGGIPFVAWDYVPAQPLDQMLARAVEEQFPIAIDNALLIVEKVAAAAAAASAVEVGGGPLVHGFLVPNLVVIGNDGEALLGGFGLSRGLRANLGRAAVKKVAAPYLAPEVLAGEAPSGRSDVYSLGAILFQLLTGASLPEEPADRTLALEHPRMAFEEGAVPQDVAAILRRSLASRPEERYGSAAEFKRELERLLYGGAYSPTTFNLALFMDRLYRGEIEEEDRELDRERALDVGSYYQPPKAEASRLPSPPAGEAPKPGRTALYAAVGGAVVLLSVIAYLLISRPSAPPAVDQEAQKRMLQDLVNTQVAQALKEKEEQLRKELEAEKAKTDELRTQLERQKQAPGAGARQVPSQEEQRLQRELAAREAEQKRKEEELARVRQQQAEEGQARALQLEAARRASLQATPVPVAPTAPPPTATAAAVPPPTVAVSAAAPGAIATVQPAGEAPTAGVPGTPVRVGDLVEMGRDVVPPEAVYKPMPAYPPLAERQRAAGVVVLDVLVDENGAVRDVKVVRGVKPDFGLDAAAVAAVRTWRYKPATKAGVRVKIWISVSVTFKLQA